jgi:hypothetical protein
MKVFGLGCILNDLYRCHRVWGGECFQQCMSAPRTAVARHARDRYIARPLIPLGDVVILGFNYGVYAILLGGECLYLAQCLGFQPT